MAEESVCGVFGLETRNNTNTLHVQHMCTCNIVVFTKLK